MSENHDRQQKEVQYVWKLQTSESRTIIYTILLTVLFLIIGTAFLVMVKFLGVIPLKEKHILIFASVGGLFAFYKYLIFAKFRGNPPLDHLGRDLAWSALASVYSVPIIVGASQASNLISFLSSFVSFRQARLTFV